MSKIRMYATRRMIDLDAPSPEQVEIEDIAQGLSQVNRFTGHTSRPYSVAEHSVMVSWCVPQEMALEALMHDASEAYLGDVSSPLKEMLPPYRILETLWMEAISTKFDLGDWGRFEIKKADSMALVVEMSLLVLRQPAVPEQDVNAREAIDMAARMRTMLVRNRATTPRAVNREFLERFHELMAKRHMATLDQKRGA